MSKKISCRFLQRADYYAPDELRHCCKRYFYKGKIMGDVKICDANSDTDVKLDNIISHKKNIINRINNGEKTDCYGCPVLEKKEWLDVEEEKFDHISIEHHARCNMRCTYCSETYYGGKVAKYNLFKSLNELVLKNKIRDDAQVAWGGGEPTMAKDFKEIIEFINSDIKPKSQRFFSNAINYSEDIADLLKKNIASLTTSVDAGSIESFKKIRGVRQYTKVLKNLKKYYDCSPNNTVIKFIFTELNSTKEEVGGFVNDIKKYGLENANFLISANYKDENLTKEQGILILYMHALLVSNGSTTCVLDDHVRPRINKLAEIILNDHSLISKFPDEVSKAIQSIKETQKDVKEIIVWGIGEYANLLLNNSISFSNSKVKFFVDSNHHKQGTEFRNSIVLKPNEVVNCKEPILIASSFWYHDIVNTLIGYGVDQKRILSSSLI